MAAIGLASTADPLPGLDFFAAFALLHKAVGAIAAVIPALAAARRDPLAEL